MTHQLAMAGLLIPVLLQGYLIASGGKAQSCSCLEQQHCTDLSKIAVFIGSQQTGNGQAPLFPCALTSGLQQSVTGVCVCVCVCVEGGGEVG